MTTAAIVLTPDESQINQPIRCSLTLTNAGLSSVSVLSITPLVRMTGSTDPTTYNTGVALGAPDLGPGVPLDIPAGESRTFAFGATSFAPTTEDPNPGTYDVLAEVRMSDGEEIRPTPAVWTVNPLPPTQP